ncbi:MAG: Thiamine-monophosphate kinase [Bacteroidetes bacterium ADurb.Bin408]|nr:MAG: Thiamine-monophosphate kinase [Bacteroidetes bacterium ADurb.Bin408]
MGEINKDQVVYRNTAAQGDIIYVTGDLGAAYMGLLLLEREKHVYKSNPEMQPDLEGRDYLLERQLKPEPRLAQINLLRKNGIKPTAMIDISDGLASEIIHICKQSGVGAQIYEDKIPLDAMTVSVAEEFSILPAVAALSGGEDYELLFTIHQNDYEKIKNLKDFTPIGHITDKHSGINLVGKNGEMVPIKAQGWDAFKEND